MPITAPCVHWHSTKKYSNTKGYNVNRIKVYQRQNSTKVFLKSTQLTLRSSLSSGCDGVDFCSVEHECLEIKLTACCKSVNEPNYATTCDVTPGLWEWKWGRKKISSLCCKTRADLLTWSNAGGLLKSWRHWRRHYPTIHTHTHTEISKPTVFFGFFAKEWSVCQRIPDTPVKAVNSNVFFMAHYCRTTLQPYSCDSAGQMSVWSLRATKAWAWTGGWWSSSGSLTPSSLTPKSPSSTTSPSRTDSSVSFPMELCFMRWGGIGTVTVRSVDCGTIYQKATF